MKAPKHLDLDRTKGLTVQWRDGTESFYPVDHLRRYSPSAEARELREELERNPLAVLYTFIGRATEAVDAELVGSYVRIRFSDGHDTGLYTWNYLRSIDPNAPSPPANSCYNRSPDSPPDDTTRGTPAVPAIAHILFFALVRPHQGESRSSIVSNVEYLRWLDRLKAAHGLARLDSRRSARADGCGSSQGMKSTTSPKHTQVTNCICHLVRTRRKSWGDRDLA